MSLTSRRRITQLESRISAPGCDGCRVMISLPEDVSSTSSVKAGIS